VLKLRDQKITRFIGITSHHDPEVLKTALERHDFDCTQMALNAGMVGMQMRQKPLSERETQELSTTLSRPNKAAMDLFLSHHVDA